MRKYVTIFSLLLCFSAYSQIDSLKFIVNARKIDQISNQFINIDYDTLMNGFHNYNGIYNGNVTNSYLGNIGQAYRTNTFSDLNDYDLLFARNFSNQYYTPNNLKYITSTRRLSEIRYTTGPKEDQTLRVLHNQNINESFNVGFDYNSINATGRYNHQSTSNKSIGVYSAFNSDRYNAMASFSLNKFKLFENGGIQGDQYIRNDTLRNQYSSETIPVNLTDKSLVYNRSIYLNQSYSFGKKDTNWTNDTVFRPEYKPLITLQLVVDHKRDYRYYQADNVDTSEFSFYLNVTNPDGVFDSVSIDKTDLIYQVGFDLYSEMWDNLKVYLNYGNEFEYYGSLMNDSTDLLLEDPHNDVMIDYERYTREYYRNNYLGSILDFQRSDISSRVYYKKYTSGYKSGEQNLGVNIKKKQKESFEFFNFKRSIVVPVLLEQKYYSHLLQWDNSFNNKMKTELELGYVNNKYKFDVAVTYNILSNYIYIDSIALPQQYGGSFGVLSGHFQKCFKVGNVYSKTKVVYQMSDIDNSESVISFPEWQIYSALYFQNTFKKVLHFQIGIDGRYFTEYFGYSYMPATSQFYNQRETKLGNYPYFNVFLNLTLKRARIFIMLEHANEGLFDNLENNYFTVVNYPMNPRVLKFGLSWRFYD